VLTHGFSQLPQARQRDSALFDRIRPNSAASPSPPQRDDEDDEDGDELASGA